MDLQETLAKQAEEGFRRPTEAERVDYLIYAIVSPKLKYRFVAGVGLMVKEV